MLERRTAREASGTFRLSLIRIEYPLLETHESPYSDIATQ